MKLRMVYKGGDGSGHFNHEGRPGKQGGSLPGKGGAAAAPSKSGKVMDLTSGDTVSRSMFEKDGKISSKSKLPQGWKRDGMRSAIKTISKGGKDYKVVLHYNETRPHVSVYRATPGLDKPLLTNHVANKLGTWEEISKFIEDANW